MVVIRKGTADENTLLGARRRRKRRKPVRRGGLFGTMVKNRSRAMMISIKSPTAFRESIRKVKKGRFNVSDQRALQQAKNRAGAQLKRKNLSAKERRQFRQISKIKIPKAKKKGGK